MSVQVAIVLGVSTIVRTAKCLAPLGHRVQVNSLSERSETLPDAGLAVNFLTASSASDRASTMSSPIYFHNSPLCFFNLSCSLSVRLLFLEELCLNCWKSFMSTSDVVFSRLRMQPVRACSPQAPASAEDVHTE